MRQVIAKAHIEPYGMRIAAENCTVRRMGFGWWRLVLPGKYAKHEVNATAKWDLLKSVVIDVPDEAGTAFDIVAVTDGHAMTESPLKVYVWKKS